MAGEQGGKTILGAIWLRREFDKWKGKPVNAVVGAPTYKILKQSTIATYRQLLNKSHGTWGEVDGVFRFHDGRCIWFRSGTDPDSVVGIPNVVCAHLDEGGKCSRMFFFNIQGRCARMQGPLILTTTPYSMNYVPKELISAYESGDRTDIEYSRWRSIDNPTYPREEYERLRTILPRKIFQMRLEGIHTKMEGLVFEDFSDDNLIGADVVPTPKDTEVYGGIDWGFEHPFALTVRAFPQDGKCYTISVLKRSGLSASQQIEAIRAKTTTWGVKCWYAGADRPDMIADVNAAGISCVKYHEGRNEWREVNAGNQKHAELIRDRRYMVVRGMDQWEELRDEYDTYHWDVKEGEDTSRRENPVALNDDLISAERYCTVGTFHLLRRMVKPVIMPLDYELHHDSFDPSARTTQPQDWTDL